MVYLYEIKIDKMRHCGLKIGHILLSFNTLKIPICHPYKVLMSEIAQKFSFNVLEILTDKRFRVILLTWIHKVKSVLWKLPIFLDTEKDLLAKQA